MRRRLLALALAALTTPLRAATPCEPVESIEGPPVHVIIYGYPDSPLPRPDPLTMVDRDLVNMSRFFDTLAPRLAFVHGVKTPKMEAIFGEARRPATWRALLGSVSTVIADIDGAPSVGGARPQVYLYFVGHGHVAARERLRIFAQPEDDPAGPGFDGQIDSRLIAEHIVTPLAERADVHLIVDTCHGSHAVQTRSGWSGRARMPPSMAYAMDFAGSYPSVGALLAGRGLTPEVEPYGGVFSHLVRSLAIGGADFDRDGIITYGEMAIAFPQVVPTIEETPEPEVIPPGGDRSRAFIDWRASRAAGVCFPGDIEGRFTIYDAPEVYATAHLPGAPRVLWLPLGRTLGLETWGSGGRYFVAQSGPVEFMETPPFSLSDATPGEALGGASPTWDPLPTMMVAEPSLSAHVEAPPAPSLLLNAGAAVLGGVTLFDVAGIDDVQEWMHADLSGRIGHGRHRLLGEVGYARASAHAQRTDPRGGPPPILGHRVGARIGYGRVFSEGALDVAGGALVGLHQMWGESGPPEAWRMLIADVALRSRFIWPLEAGARWGARLDIELGASLAGQLLGPTIKLAAGLDFESVVYP